MGKTLSGAEAREGKTVNIGDRRYGLREEYAPAVMRETQEFYRSGHNLTIKEVKNPLLQTVRTVKG